MATQATPVPVSTRSKEKTYLLGTTLSSLTGGKLPSSRMVLQVFLHKHFKEKKTVRQSSKETIDNLMEFWLRARIPTKDQQHSQSKLEKLFDKWSKLKKNKGRASETQKKNEEKFMSKIDFLFDIAHSNAMNIMTNAEDRAFLEAQREEGRRGAMIGVDKNLAAKEEKSERKKKALAEKQKREKDKMEQVVLESSTEPESDGELVEAGNEDFKVKSLKYRSRAALKKQGSDPLLTPSVVAALDRGKLSDRNATYLLNATATALNADDEGLLVSRSKLYRTRKKLRMEMSEKIKNQFGAEGPFVIHWDGKLMNDLKDAKFAPKLDRLPISISGGGSTQLLTVAKLQNGTGQAQAQAVLDAVEEWGLDGQICAMSFDTTSTNTGREKGACTLIEKKLGKLLKLACRHHVMELIIGAVFKVNNTASSAPYVPLFKRFQDQWACIKTKDFEAGVNSDHVNALVKDMRESTVAFAQDLMAQGTQRDDYMEFLQLVVLFLGGIPANGVIFKAPGAMHHARWMSKVIYSLKIFMFRKHFRLTAKEEDGILKVCIFAVRIYLRAWMLAPLAARAPSHDLELLKSLIQFKEVDEKSARAAYLKLQKHHWYLQPELVCLALFDQDVSSNTKLEMVRKLKSSSSSAIDARSLSNESFTLHASLPDFVSSDSTLLFAKLNLPTSFLDEDPEKWEENEDYQRAKSVVNNLKVVNDQAERGVALTQQYNGFLTRDENQFQSLLRVVENHRRNYPNCNISTLYPK